MITTKSLIRFLLIAITTIVVVIAILFVWPRGLTAPKDKMVAISIFEKLESFKPAIEQCLINNKCGAADGSSIHYENGSVYLTQSNHELVGINNDSKVVVILKPEKSGSKITWICYGHPSNRMPIDCEELTVVP